MEINDLAVHLHEAGREAVESGNTVIPDLLAHIEHQRRALEWMARRSLSYNGDSAENFQSICNLALLATKDEQFVMPPSNAQPRALTWTTEPPKVAGRYYQRWNWNGHWGNVDVITIEQRSVDKIRKNVDRQWAGPIPMPTEPTL